jgi:hypothetical protein
MFQVSSQKKEFLTLAFRLGPWNLRLFNGRWWSRTTLFGFSGRRLSCLSYPSERKSWWLEQDLHLRPRVYETRALHSLSYPALRRNSVGAASLEPRVLTRREARAFYQAKLDPADSTSNVLAVALGVEPR